MTHVVRLLGPPHVVRAGDPPPAPRGRKPWALLAYVLASSGPVPRTRVQQVLFPDADDPQAALRWALSQVRRAVGGALLISGDPLRCTTAPGTTVDVLDVLAGRVPTTWPLEEARLPLLEGAEPDVAEFGLWLSGRRYALEQAAEQLHRAAGPETGVVVRVPGSLHGRRDRVTRAAAGRRGNGSRDGGPHARPAARGTAHDLVLAGIRMLDAGAATDGVRTLHTAVRLAREADDLPVLAEALLRYGTAVVHGVAIADPAASAALREADRIAVREGLPTVAATARRELGFVAASVGDLPGALRALDGARAAAGDRAEDRAGVHGVRGFALVDAGAPETALRELDAAVRFAEDADRPRQLAIALTHRARVHLHRRAEDRAADDLGAARTIVEDLDWTAVGPWVDALRGDLLLREGRLAEAERVLTGARAMAEVLDDACWRAVTSLGTARVDAARGRHAEAAAALGRARTVAAAGPTVCCWIELALHEAWCEVTAEFDPAAAAREAVLLTTNAERTGLRAYAARDQPKAARTR